MVDTESVSGKTGKVHLSVDDKRIIVSWLEIDENYTSVFGAKGKTTIGGKPKETKAAGFAKMAAHLCRKTKNPDLPKLDVKKMSSRWDTYRKEELQGGAQVEQEHWLRSDQERAKEGHVVSRKT